MACSSLRRICILNQIGNVVSKTLLPSTQQSVCVCLHFQDTFSLGVVLWELLTLQEPWAGTSTWQACNYPAVMHAFPCPLPPHSKRGSQLWPTMR